MSKLDEYYTFPTYTQKYLSPERICDNIQHQLKLLGIELSDEAYACIWDNVEERNSKLNLLPMTAEEKYADRRRLNLIKE